MALTDNPMSLVITSDVTISTILSIPYNKNEYRTPGTYTFTVPAGVTSLKITVAGAGGGGGGYAAASKKK